MNCISKCLVTNEEERRILNLARTVRNKMYWSIEDYEFFYQRYHPTRDYLYKMSKNGMSWDIDRREMTKAQRGSTKECVREAQEIKRREVDPKNVMYNLGVFTLQSIFVGLSMGMLFRFNEDAFRPNYREKV